ncbi:MAG TPA: tripartite tricarboxylate transporter TctB family protein [Bacilli bacterium]|nr:tripartite tricarboxylate transporter TctB family protein [Bacilli bacterium]
MKKVHLSIGIALIAVAGYVLYTTRSFPNLGGTDIGPGFFPNLIAWLMLLLAVLLIFSSLRQEAVPAEEGDGAEESASETKTQTSARFLPLFGVAATVLYVVLIALAGFYVATPIFLLALMWTLRFRKLVPLVVTIALITVFIYLVFEVMLKVPMPSGLFG